LQQVRIVFVVRVVKQKDGGYALYELMLCSTSLTDIWMMAAGVAMGGTTSVWQYDAYCIMPVWLADPLVLIMVMGIRNLLDSSLILYVILMMRA
jgi:hypothetical protein